jgi:hypothetical protein
MEENDQVQSDEGFKKAKEYKIWGIKTPDLYGSKERESPIDMGHPQEWLTCFDQGAEKAAKRIAIVHQITGEDIISDYNPLHQCKLVEREEGKCKDK